MKNATKYTKGQKVTYKKTYAFGKEGVITAKVVAILGRKVLLDSGDSFFAN